MASVQQQAPVAQNDEHNAAVEEMTKEAQSLLTKTINNAAQREVSVTAGAMMNSAKLSMKLDQTHEFIQGKFLVKPSQNIDRGQPGAFVHQGELIGTGFPNGSSKGAVVYSEYVKPGEAYIGFLQSYLLAWNVPFSKFWPSPRNQVYVECGRVGTFENVDWEKIEEKLNKSSNKSECYNPTSGAYATAAINREGSAATLGAVFTERRLGN